MTVGTTTARVRYAGDGISTAFPVPFAFLDESDLEVIERTASNGAETTRALVTDYSVSGGQGSSGTVHAVVAPAATVEWIIRRGTARTQSTDYTANDPFPAETHERALDRLTMIAQEQDEALGRVPTLPKSTGLTTLQLPEPASSLLLSWNSGADGLVNVAAADVDLTTVSDFMSTLLDDADAGTARTTMGIASASATAEGVVELATDAETATGTDTTRAVTPAGLAAHPALVGRNALINGGFAVAQRGTTFDATTKPANSDDAILLDRWRLLSDGNDIVDVTQQQVGREYECQLDVETASKKFGIAQIIEARDAIGLIEGGTATLSFQAKRTGTTPGNIRVAVLAWDGMADAPTTDLVSAWNAEGADPTFVANWTAENVPSALALTTSYQTFTIAGISIDTVSAKNLAVFIWSDETGTTVGDFLHVRKVQLEEGAATTDFERRDIGTELGACQRYLPAMSGVGALANASVATATIATGIVPFLVAARVSPTGITVSNATHFTVTEATVDRTCTAVAFASISSPHACAVNFTVTSGLTAGRGCYAKINNVSGSILFTGCEL